MSQTGSVTGYEDTHTRYIIVLIFNMTLLVSAGILSDI